MHSYEGKQFDLNNEIESLSTDTFLTQDVMNFGNNQTNTFNSDISSNNNNNNNFNLNQNYYNLYNEVYFYEPIEISNTLNQPYWPNCLDFNNNNSRSSNSDSVRKTDYFSALYNGFGFKVYPGNSNIDTTTNSQGNYGNNFQNPNAANNENYDNHFNSINSYMQNNLNLQYSSNQAQIPSRFDNKSYVIQNDFTEENQSDCSFETTESKEQSSMKYWIKDLLKDEDSSSVFDDMQKVTSDVEFSRTVLSTPPSEYDSGVNSEVELDDDILTCFNESYGKKRKYGCKKCGKRFGRPSSLKTHLNTHTGKKPYICPFENCSKVFNARSNMTRHYKTHYKLPTGEYLLPSGKIVKEAPRLRELSDFK